MSYFLILTLLLIIAPALVGTTVLSIRVIGIAGISVVGHHIFIILVEAMGQDPMHPVVEMAPVGIQFEEAEGFHLPTIIALPHVVLLQTTSLA